MPAFNEIFRNMMLLSAGIAVATTLTSAAHAADEESNAPHDWAGFYVGLGIEGSGSGIDLAGVGKKGDLDIDDRGFGLSGIAGYNFTSGPWVFGVESSLGSVGFEESKAVAGLGTVGAESNWIGAIGLRGGYAFDNLLVYGTAGLAVTDLEVRSSLGGTFDETAPGVMVGIGAEYAFSESWSARAELLGYAFQAEETLAGSKRDFDFGHGVVRMGMSYKF